MLSRNVIKSASSILHLYLRYRLNMLHSEVAIWVMLGRKGNIIWGYERFMNATLVMSNNYFDNNKVLILLQRAIWIHLAWRSAAWALLLGGLGWWGLDWSHHQQFGQPAWSRRGKVSRSSHLTHPLWCHASASHDLKQEFDKWDRGLDLPWQHMLRWDLPPLHDPTKMLHGSIMWNGVWVVKVSSTFRREWSVSVSCLVCRRETVDSEQYKERPW